MMKKIMLVLAMACIFTSKPVMATYQYSFEAPYTPFFGIAWSWEFSSPSIFSTSTDVAGNMLMNIVAPTGYEIVKVNIAPGSVAWVDTFFDTNNDGQWDRDLGVRFDVDIAQVGVFAGADVGNTLRISNENVPEPASVALLGIALAGLVATRRKKAI